MPSLDNLLLDTDSYKASHWLQYPPGTEATYLYLESRGGVYDRTVFFGLQAILKQALARPFTAADVAAAGDLLRAHGEPFNAAGWQHILDVHGGHLPVRIRAVPEGTVVPTHQALMTVESTDPGAFWLPSYLETLLLRVWYPTTVATLSWHVRQLIARYLAQTSDDATAQLPFKLHDFGSRGVSSRQSAAIGGLAHLVNFQGTDTLAALALAVDAYHEPLAAWSIPAAEHGTIVAWGRDGEADAYRNLLRHFAKPGALLSVVSDSYDIYHAIEALWGGALRQQVIDSGALVVIRPDSGNPEEVVQRCLQMLDAAFGHTLNSKGYRVLKHVRLIQGDGMNPESIAAVLERTTRAGYATDNLTFGMGGALLQKVNRDTQAFALKCSAVRVHGRWRPVWKDPVTDPGKRSKRGRVMLAHNRTEGSWRTLEPASGAADPALPTGHVDGMVTVWENGRLVRDWTLAEIRARAAGQAV